MNRRRLVVIATALATVALVAGVASGTAVALETADAVESPSPSPSTAADATTGEDPTCSFPLTVTDDSGTEITLEDEPESVVTLAPSAAQTMWEIGAEEKVTGTTRHAANLEGADERTNVSTDAATIEPEIVVEEDPDLVLAPSSNFVTDETVETLRESGLSVYYFDSADSIDEVRERTLLIGSLVGECEGAAATVEWMDEELAVVEETIEGEDRPAVLYTFFGFTAGEDTFIHSLVEAAGGTNVAAEVGIEEYAELNEETVVEVDPDWIVLNTNSPEVPDSPAYESTTAVQNDQVLILDVNKLNRPGPRTVHAISELAETFHPEAYAAAEVREAGSSDDPDSSSGGDDADPGTTSDGSAETTADEADPDGIPGFGLTAAVLASALVAVVLAGIRYGNTDS